MTDDIAKIFPSKEELDAARRQALAFHTETCRAAMMAADAAPAPIEAGESPVSVSVSGQIELIE